MSKGFGKIQRSIGALIRAEPDGAWAYEHLAERIYGTALFTRAQKNAIGRALARMRLPGTWAVWQASFKMTGGSGCSTPAASRAGARSPALCDPPTSQPGGTYFGWCEEAKRRAKQGALNG